MIQVFAVIAILFLLVAVSFYLANYILAYYLIWLVLILLILLCVFLLQEFVRVIIKRNAPFVSSNNKFVKKVADLGGFKEGDVVYELGCGDARFLREVANRYKVKAIGYEYSVIPYLLAIFYNFITRSKVKVYYKDIAKANLADADYVYCYLMNKQMAVLEQRFLKELKPGAIIISNTFQFKTWRPEKSIVLDENKKYHLSNNLYFYRVV